MRILRSDVVVDAAPHQVWDLLTDFTSYADWNPLVPHIEGEARRGQQVTLEVTPPGQDPRRVEAKVVKAVPGEELVLRTRVGPVPLLVAEHRFRLVPTEHGGTHLVQRQDLTGPLVPFVKDTILAVLHGLQAMNRELKTRVENAATA